MASSELIATVLREAHRFENPYGATVVLGAVGSGGEGLSLKGPSDELGPEVNGTYRFHGKWTKYANRRTGKSEPQFVYTSFVPVAPKGQEAVVGYLKRIPGIGQGIAESLWKLAGEACIDELEQGSDRLKEVPRLNSAIIERAQQWLAEERTIRDSLVEMLGLLEGRGFPKSIARDCVKAFGARAAWIVRKNPFVLRRFKGCGFKLADKMYCSLGLNPAAIKRQVFAVEQLIRDQGGHTWYPVTIAEQHLRQSIGGADVDAARTLAVGSRGKKFAKLYTEGWQGPPSMDGDACWLALASQAANERRGAHKVRHLMDRPLQLANVDRSMLAISDHQWEELSKALAGGQVGILAGGPGTGKTFVAGKLIELINQAGFASHVMATAPTGKAAVRLTESLQAAGASVRARTIHSLLQVQANEDGSWRFYHNQARPLGCRLLVVDESSMIDTDLFWSLIQAVPDDCFVLFLGDTQQLLPVGHGAPLRDMIRAVVPTGELREVQRNSGEIVQACHAIREGKPWRSLTNCDGSNLTHVSADGEASIVQALLNVSAECGASPVDCQVVVPMNDKGPLSRKPLNLLLQRHLNPGAKEPGKMSLGDKVINTANRYFTSLGPESEDVDTDGSGRVYVANGEMGFVVEEEGRFVVIELQSPYRRVRVPLVKEGEEGGASSWDLGYAISVHKSQGSEWPGVVVVLDEGARRMLDRAWIYTAISRAKQHCVLAGDLSLAEFACEKNRIDERKTFMGELIKGV